MNNIIILKEKWSFKNISLKSFIEEGNYPIEWEEFFTDKETLDEIQKISDFLEKRAKVTNIFPEINRVFRALIPLNKIKLVILGQDPYHNAGSAVGLAFSVPTSDYINHSLKNIYQEIENSGYSPIKDGNLTAWKNQGVLLLNTALTVEEKNPGSHLALWEKFTTLLLKYIVKNTERVAWLLMGRQAIKYGDLVIKETPQGGRGHRIFMTSHPSPLGARKNMKNGNEEIPAFLGSNVFSRINDFLEEKILW